MTTKNSRILLLATLQMFCLSVMASPSSDEYGVYCLADYVFVGKINKVELRLRNDDGCESVSPPITMIEYENRQITSCAELIYSVDVIRNIRLEEKIKEKYIDKNYSVYFKFTDNETPNMKIAAHSESFVGETRIFPILYFGGISRKHEGYEFGLGYPRHISELNTALSATDEACKLRLELLKQKNKKP